MAGPEAIVEKYLVAECKKIGGVAEKFTSPNKRAVPDRICSFPYDLIVFVECKAEGVEPTLAQKEDHKKRRLRGHQVEVVDSKESVDVFIKGIVTAMRAMRSLGEGML